MAPRLILNETVSVCITWYWGAIAQPLLRWKTIIITYSERVFVDLGTQHTMRLFHIVVCGLCGFTILFHLSPKSTIFGKRLLNIKCVFWLSPQSLSETFLFPKKHWARCDKNVYWSSRTVPVICLISIKLESPRQSLEKYSNIKFYENPFSGSRVIPCWQIDRRTDRYDEASERFSQFF
jgi:hypothetical protein